jgi:phage terminase large subunit-like protein
MTTDTSTRAWIRNESDERAAASGCRFDVLRGAWTVYWIERFCRLYEGEGYAGNPLILHGCKDCDHSDFQAVAEWDDTGREIHIERARVFAECVAAGHRIDWQYECFMRLFGWVRDSEKWGREVRRFKKSSIWIPKKSGKSPTLAALGMYLLAGDGEPGQKVFLAAKDGDQARTNAGKHAVEMWLQSDELRQECTLNRTILQITHEPSRSIMRPLSSSNSRTQQSKEGLNGSVLVDETHVVDRAFVDIISRAGISRSEALFAEFSTAGDNPDSYGKESFDYSGDVLAGKVTDEEHFAAIYAAPQETTDAQLAADFDRYADMANPAMGRLIERKEIRRDYERSKRKIEDLCNFKKYRLNIWQHSSNPWLRLSDWYKCRKPFDISELLGRECYGGLDLSLRWDTSAFVLLFPWEEREGQPTFRLLVRFFLPRETARKTTDMVSWFDWEKSGDITLTEGDTTDFPLIRRTIREASKKYDLRCLAYDDRFAETIAQELQDEDGIEMVDFNQTIQNFAEPMGLFEKDIIDGRLEHPGNRCLDWQAGNATKNNKGMLVKPELHDVKKIDGITAAVQARAMAAASQGPSVYESRGIVTLGERQSEQPDELIPVPSKDAPVQWGGNWGNDDD